MLDVVKTLKRKNPLKKKKRKNPLRTFVSKVMSLLFNMLSRFVMVFLPMRKRLLITWLQSLSTVFLDPKKIKFPTVSTFSPSIRSFPSYSGLQTTL